MITLFKQFLSEDNDKLKHLTHVEDRIIDHGHTGYDHAVSHLYAVHDKLRGRRHGRSTTTVKNDGAPSIVFGHHPENGKFFVGTKSVFNKTPKINHTEADIEKNHGHAPGLVSKLKHALKHLPKITPKERIYQGDVMYTKENVHDDGKHYHFTPNTITYSTPKHSKEGKKIAKAHIGVAVHTEYHSHDGTFHGLRAHFNPDISHFSSHPDAHLISHHYNFEDPKYHEHHAAGFKHHMATAKALHKDIHKTEYGVVQSHAAHVNMYINHRVRTSTKEGLGLSAHGFKSWLKDRSETHKSPAERRKAIAAHDHVHEYRHSFDKVFKLHHELTRAKENLVHSLNQRQSFGHHIGGVKSNPEGYVDSLKHKGNTILSKFVLRQEFSKHNFQTGRPTDAK